MIIFNKKLFKNLYIFSDGSVLIDSIYNKQNKFSNFVFLRKDLKSFEKSFKWNFKEKKVNLNTSFNYRNLLFK